jgi:hypothetical protein
VREAFARRGHDAWSCDLLLADDGNLFHFQTSVMGVLDLGAAAEFHYRDNSDQMRVVDIHLFLADQVRFEMMRRLKWISRFEGRKYSLLTMVLEFAGVKEICRENPPELSASNSGFEEYKKLTAGDKEVFIRRLLQQALDAFKKRL